MNKTINPIIGITSDYCNGKYRIAQDYFTAIISAGGLPIIIGSFSTNTTIIKKLNSRERINIENVRDNYVCSIAQIIDGLLLTGGGDLSPRYYGEKILVPRNRIRVLSKLRCDFELSLIREIHRMQKPLLGICLGMQLINVAFGGTLYQDLEYQTGSLINHSNSNHYVKVSNFLSSQIKDSKYLVNSTHHQAVKNLAEGLVTFAISDDNIVEGFYKKDYPFLVGVQWHPERILQSDLSIEIFKLFIKKAKEVNKSRDDN